MDLFKNLRRAALVKRDVEEVRNILVEYKFIFEEREMAYMIVLLLFEVLNFTNKEIAEVLDDFLQRRVNFFVDF